MKTRIFRFALILAMALPAGTMAQHHKGTHHGARHHLAHGDSVLEFQNPAKIIIVEQGPKGQACCAGQDGLSVNLARKGKNQWKLVTGGLGFGLDGAISQPEGTGLQMGKSFEVLWLKALAAEYQFGNQSVSFGLGFDWKNFKMTGAPLRMVKQTSHGGITADEYPLGTEALNSTLKIFSLDVPILYSVELPKCRTKFTLGPVVNFNTYSSLKTNYINALGNKTTEFTKGMGQRYVTMELFGSVSWNCVGLYLKGSPFKAMKSYSDINFHPLTVGVIFFM